MTPYDKADHQEEEAKLVPSEVVKKNRKLFTAGMVLAGLIVGIVILSHVAGLVSSNGTPTNSSASKPVTMSPKQSDSFVRQQAGQAEYMKGLDHNRHIQSAEDIVLGKGVDDYEEADGVPRKTKAQDEAEHGRTAEKSPAQLRYEKAALEAQHRRQNDLDSSVVSVDFSDYFDKQKPSEEKQKPVEKTENSEPNHHALADPEETEPVSSKKEPHDPKEDYTFDSSFGKLYRLMEDTILETVLVNRLTGAAIGPVITMITADVYSQSGSHLLIPKGTRLLGSVSAVGSLSQERLFVAFHRMIMPDGYSVSLDKFKGLDVVGQTGLRDLVNRHYMQIFGASLALAAISATTQIGNVGGSYGNYDWGVSMRNGVSQGLGQSAQRVMERFMNVLPTFTIRERARVKVMLSGDLLLPDTRNHTMDPDL